MSDRDENIIESELPQVLNPWQGVHAEIFADTTDELDVEGSRMCAKTTLLLDKEISFLRRWPGIHILICRYTDIATRTLLKPRFEAICKLRGFTDWKWNDKQLAYEFSNGSKAFAFGLKAANQNERYDKIRGTDVSRVYNDQAESTPADIGQELRASLRQKGYPHQLTFSPNPPNTRHWLADPRHGGFPEDNSAFGRKYYRLEIYDNAYNLAEKDIERMERTYPPDHAKHGSMILGKRGFNVIGDPIFEDTFNRVLHLQPYALAVDRILLEAFESGKHNPCWVVAQRLYDGGIALVGGIIAEELFLEDFIPIVQAHRSRWFQNYEFKTCSSPPPAGKGSHATPRSILQRAGFRVRHVDGCNSADDRLDQLEQFATYMRRTNDERTEFVINNDLAFWQKASRQGVEPWPFMAQAFEAGAVWDEHFRSVGNNTVRQMKADDWFANAMTCVQNIEVNFCGNRRTPAAHDTQLRNARAATHGAYAEDYGSVLRSSHGWLA